MKNNKKIIHKVNEQKNSNLDFITLFYKILALGTSLYHLYIAYFGAPYSLQHRPTHFMLVFMILFISFLSHKKNEFVTRRIPIYSCLLIILTILSSGYLIINVNSLMKRITFVTELTFCEYIRSLIHIIVLGVGGLI